MYELLVLCARYQYMNDVDAMHEEMMRRRLTENNDMKTNHFLSSLQHVLLSISHDLGRCVFRCCGIRFSSARAISTSGWCVYTRPPSALAHDGVEQGSIFALELSHADVMLSGDGAVRPIGRGMATTRKVVTSTKTLGWTLSSASF